MIRVAAALILVISLMGSALAQPATPKMRGFDKSSIGIDQNLGTALPLDTVWKTTEDKPVLLREFFMSGKPVILVPVFFRCNAACLVVLDGSVKALNALHVRYPEEEFQVVVFSIHPKETPIDAKIRQSLINKVYADSSDVPEEKAKLLAHANDTWHFVTGDLNSITKLTTALGFRFTYEPEIDRINHAAGIMVASPEGIITNYFYGKDYSFAILKRALDESRIEKLGEPDQPILLGCFMMDPNTGKYRMVVGRTLQVGGIATVLVLGCSIFILSTRNRQRSRLSGGGGSSPE